MLHTTLFELVYTPLKRQTASLADPWIERPIYEVGI